MLCLRQDIGRLAPGMKADIVLVDLECADMQPARDPLRSLVYHAAERAVRDVYVDGRQVVADFKVLALNQADAAGRLAEAQARMLAAVRQRDYKARSADDIAPRLADRLLTHFATAMAGDTVRPAAAVRRHRRARRVPACKFARVIHGAGIEERLRFGQRRE